MDNVQTVMDLASSIRTKAVATGPDAIAVDPHFEEDPKVAKIVEYGIKHGKNVLLVGPTGSGKSSLAINVCARLTRRAEICSLDGETSIDNLVAGMILAEQNGQTVTTIAKGAALRAYEEGAVLVLEEVDFANPDILAALHRILETQSTFFVCNVGGQKLVVKRHSLFAVIATANTIGTGEDSFIYAGTKALNQAFMNRFALTVQMDYLEPAKEVKVVCAKTGADKSLVTKLVQVAGEVRQARKASAAQQLTATISTRDLLEWAGLIHGTGLKPMEAAEYAFLNRTNEADREVIADFVRNKVGA